jgi:hypothetical protein
MCIRKTDPGKICTHKKVINLAMFNFSKIIFRSNIKFYTFVEIRRLNTMALQDKKSLDSIQSNKVGTILSSFFLYMFHMIN